MIIFKSNCKRFTRLMIFFPQPQATDDLSVRRGEWVYADLAQQVTIASLILSVTYCIDVRGNYCTLKPLGTILL